MKTTSRETLFAIIFAVLMGTMVAGCHGGIDRGILSPKGPGIEGPPSPPADPGGMPEDPRGPGDIADPGKKDPPPKVVADGPEIPADVVQPAAAPLPEPEPEPEAQMDDLPLQPDRAAPPPGDEQDPQNWFNDITMEIEVIRCTEDEARCRGQAGNIEEMARTILVSWRVSNVKAAFLRLPALRLGDNNDILRGDGSIKRFRYTRFIGDIDRRYIGLQSGADSADVPHFVTDLLKKPLAEFDARPAEVQDAISGDREALPFSFCETSIAIDPGRSCFAGRQRDVAREQIVFLPLRTGETSREGTWLLPINGDEASLGIAYADRWDEIHIGRVDITGALPLVFLPPFRSPWRPPRDVPPRIEGPEDGAARNNAEMGPRLGAPVGNPPQQ